MAINKAVRIYKNLGDGTAVQADSILMADGTIKSQPARSSEGIIPISKVPKACPCIPVNQFDNSLNNQSMNFQNPGIISAETANGKVVTARNETGSAAANRRVISFSISNTESTGGPDLVVVGDGNGLLNLTGAYGGVGPFSVRAGIVFDGNWGASFQTIFAGLTKSNPIDVHKLHLIGYDTAGSPDSSVFVGGFIKQARATFNGDAAVVSDIPLQQLLRTDSYNAYVRETDNFRMTIDGMAGLIFKLATGKRIDVTMDISSANETYSMNRQ